jgi:hypothetical protein
MSERLSSQLRCLFRQTNCVAPLGDGGQDGDLLLLRHFAPAGNFVQGSPAAGADVARRVHAADVDTGRLRQAQAAFLRFAAIARPAFEPGSRLSTPQIHSPVSTIFARSTPVSMPSPCSMYRTSSVATLPDAPAA